MSFISVQKFDENGEIQVLKKTGMKLDSVDTERSQLGTLKGKAKRVHEYAVLTPSDVNESFGNLLGAEAAVLEPMEYFWPASKPPLNHIDVDLHIAHRISRAIVGLTRTTKRGAGNTIVIHPDDETSVNAAFEKQELKEQLRPQFEGDQEGIMVQFEQPYFANPDNIQVIVHDSATKGMPLVLYVGEHDYDKPLIYVEGHGLFLNEAIARVAEYGVFVDIT